MSILCPFCLSESTALPRCPACHAPLPNTQTEGSLKLPGWRTRVQLRQDISGTWLQCEKDAVRGLAFWAPAAAPSRDASAMPGKTWGLAPLEQGLHEGREFRIWPWPEATLPSVAPMDPKAAYALWSELAGAGAFAHYREILPWEIVRLEGKWKVLIGREPASIAGLSAGGGLPPAGSIFAPERLTGNPPTEKSAVFIGAAWFLFLVTGRYPVGMPTPISWKKTNLEVLDVVVFDALRAEPGRRPSAEDFGARLEQAVSGPGMARWVGTGLMWAAGAAFLLAWAGGVLWAISVFELL
ncbi:hypothetical protein KKD52_05645 [Myxococcota bacterium]|nr:hypothetical protein [Myxococcota bacterium]MBU1509824.1 hypothetical protein [Myxococcota bacterium]